MNSNFTSLIYRPLAILSLLLAVLTITLTPATPDFSLQERVSTFLLGMIAYAVFSCAAELGKKPKQ